MKKNSIPQTWIYLGRVARPHGVRGMLSIKLENTETESLRPGVTLHLKLPKGSQKSYEVVSFAAGRLLKLKDIDDRDTVETLVGSEIFLDRSDFPDLADDEIYLSDMIGFEITTAQNEVIGEVSGFSDNAAQILIQVKTTKGKTALIPYVKPLIQAIDQTHRKIVVDLPAGLIESDDD